MEVSFDVDSCSIERDVLGSNKSAVWDSGRDGAVSTSVSLVLCLLVVCVSSDLLSFFHAKIKVEAVCFLISAVAKGIGCGDGTVVPSDLLINIVKYSFSDETGVAMVYLSWGVELLSFTCFPFVTVETVVICETLDNCALLKLV